MKAEYTTVTSKGQLVIPARMRKRLRIERGTRVAVREEDGHLILQPMTDAYIDAMQGLLGDTSAMIEYLHQERRKENNDKNKENNDKNEEVRAGRKRTARLSRPASRRATRQRSA
jgi:AbrB family looped-hinge helix DNA binding protein